MVSQEYLLRIAAKVFFFQVFAFFAVQKGSVIKPIFDAIHVMIRCLITEIDGCARKAHIDQRQPGRLATLRTSIFLFN